MITAEKRQKMEKMIYDFFTAFDKSGVNTKHYKELFSEMTDRQFDNWFNGFFNDPKAYLILHITDYEHTVKMEDVERAAKVINIPLFEYVYIPHLTMDLKHVVRTPVKVPVGYIHTKRTQQTVNQEWLWTLRYNTCTIAIFLKTKLLHYFFMISITVY